MATDLKPGRYQARLILEGFPCSDLVHHLIVTHDGEILETHYDFKCGLVGVGGVQSYHFETPRSWHPSFLDSYKLNLDMSDAC